MSDQSSQAFDRHAPHYHRSWDDLPAVRWMRARQLARLQQLLPPPATLLDLGCGTGTDAALYIAAGYRVIGLDASPGMIAEARSQGVDARLHDLSSDAPWPLTPADPPADAVLSNFGALNCIPDLRPLRPRIQQHARPGAPLLLTLIGRFCPAERLRQLRHGRLLGALHGRRSGPFPVEGVPVSVYLHPTDAVADALGARILHKEALGLLFPPPKPGDPLPALAEWDARLSPLPLLRHLGDHTFLILRG